MFKKSFLAMHYVFILVLSYLVTSFQILHIDFFPLLFSKQSTTKSCVLWLSVLRSLFFKVSLFILQKEVFFGFFKRVFFIINIYYICSNKWLIKPFFKINSCKVKILKIHIYINRIILQIQRGTVNILNRILNDVQPFITNI